MSSLRALTRRQLFARCGVGLGSIALTHLLAEDDGRALRPHFRPRAKRVIFLFMAGAPSQLELFDDKPELRRLHGQVVPPSFVEGKRFAFIGTDAKLLGAEREFRRWGQSGQEIGTLLPHTGAIADELCLLKGMRTDEINHGPAKLFVNTGSPRFGRPSMGAWVTYGIGSEANDLPGFVVLQSGPRGPRAGAPLWGNGFLPSRHQGVPFRGGSEPILHLATPDGVSDEEQRAFFDAVEALNRERLAAVGDPEIEGRIAAYEMAWRMQSSAPELVDLSSESRETLELYGVEPGRPSFAANCLLARRMVERGVRFVQLYHTDWDHHGDKHANLGEPLEKICGEVDRPSAALVADLKRRGLLEDTLVVWGGEFGRTPMSEVRDTVGRDHHIDAYTMWLAGGGVKPGITYGNTDEIGYEVVEGAVHVHDLQATILHLLGLDHERLTYRFQGRDFRLTDVHGEVVHGILA